MFRISAGCLFYFAATLALAVLSSSTAAYQTFCHQNVPLQLWSFNGKVIVPERSCNWIVNNTDLLYLPQIHLLTNYYENRNNNYTVILLMSTPYHGHNTYTIRWLVSDFKLAPSTILVNGITHIGYNPPPHYAANFTLIVYNNTINGQGLYRKPVEHEAHLFSQLELVGWVQINRLTELSATTFVTRLPDAQRPPSHYAPVQPHAPMAPIPPHGQPPRTNRGGTRFSSNIVFISSLLAVAARIYI